MIAPLLSIDLRWAYTRLQRAIRPTLNRWRAAEESGSALVEFAASAILLFTLLFGIMECSRAVYIDHFVANAAQEGARYAMVRGGSWSSSCASVTSFSCVASSSNVSSFVQSLASGGVTKSNLSVTTSWPGTDAAGASCLSDSTVPTNAAGCVVVVTVTYAFSYISPLLPQRSLSLTGTSEVTIVQ
ncbi:MAG: TadE/TadG family type IV pilus assembly protein [Janthinobacterium lividum]